MGDVVTVGQCRPLSKTVRCVLPSPRLFSPVARPPDALAPRFNVVRVSRNKAAAKAFAKF